jgi:hypothetical protein|tara:strand:+ start:225 stop:611 length:387 start_codon:yes stop_codon:yes gene_type:complete
MNFIELLFIIVCIWVLYIAIKFALEDIQDLEKEEEHNSRIDKLILGEPITYSKPKVNGNYRYDCKLPYDDSTKDLIKQLRKSGHKVRVRGSGARAKHSLEVSGGRTARMFDSSLPLKYASHVRLYITW